MTKVSQLSDTFTPTNYNLALTMNREARTTTGVVTINGEVQNYDQTIALHAKDLTIQSITIDGHASEWAAGKNDEITMQHPALTPGRHIVVVVFEGTITDAMHGLYPCYFEHDGVKKQLLATQFESHHAREVFPCIDEPAAKATFDVSLTTETGITVLGNMPISDQREEDGQLVTTFETTPTMSSYLLAWVVGDMHRKTAVTKRGIEVNVWATPAQPAETLDFALDEATKIIDFYEEYFGVDYPLKKCDHVALPDFSSGAMENWGLITYREVCLLADPKTIGPAGKHLISSVVAHELAHQWFGNLVTMKWWDYLWLNESFADFVEHIAVDALHPEWDTWLDFVLSRGIAALRRDAIDGVQPVQVTVQHPDEINTLFDSAIVYGKGARLMKMLRAFVGDEAFRKGLHEYFALHAYGNTTGDDLWACLSKSSGKDVGEFMNTWITQPGYPMLTVEPDSISQTQFFIGEHAPSERIWPIPLGAQPQMDLPEILRDPKLEVSTSPQQRFNIGDDGHFITKYTPDHLKNLLSSVSKAETIDRLTLLNDQTLLVRGRHETSATLIDLLRYYTDETNDTVWDIMAMTLGELKKFVENDGDAEKKLRALSGTIARSIYEKCGFDEKENETITETKLRGTALAMMLYGEDQSVIDEALRRFNPDSLLDHSAEIRSIIIGTAVRFAKDASVVEKLMDIYTKTVSAELKEDIMSGVTATRDPEIATKLLENCKDSSIVRSQDVAPWFIYLVRNKYTRDIAWQWLQDSWPWILKTYGGDKSFDEFPRYAAGGLVTPDQLREYKAFFEPMLGEPSLKRTILMGISEIEARLELLESDGQAVRDKLKSE